MRINDTSSYLLWVLAEPCRLRAEATRLARNHARRLVRFSAVGVIAASVQLALLDGLIRLGWDPFLANVVGILVSIQVNFLLSARVIWPDRPIHGRWRQSWVAFHGAMLSTTLLNLAVFALASLVVPRLIAAMAGIAVGATINYLVGDRLVFRRGLPSGKPPAPQRDAHTFS